MRGIEGARVRALYELEPTTIAGVIAFLEYVAESAEQQSGLDFGEGCATAIAAPGAVPGVPAGSRARLDGSCSFSPAPF